MHASTCKLKGELFSLERFIDVLKLARRHDKTSAAALTPSSSSVLFVHRVWSTTQFLAPILKSCGPKTIFLKRKRNKKDHKYIKGLHVFYKLRVKLQKKNGWHVENIFYKVVVCFFCFFNLFDVLLGILQAIELLQCLVQDLVHAYVFFFCV